MWHWTIRVCQITDMTDFISFTFRISSQIEYARLIQLFICDITAFCILSSMYPFFGTNSMIRFAMMPNIIFLSMFSSGIDRNWLNFSEFSSYDKQILSSISHLSATSFFFPIFHNSRNKTYFNRQSWAFLVHLITHSIVTRWTFWACFVDECLSPIRLKPTYQMECMVSLACLASLCMKVFILFSGHCMFLWDGPRTLIWYILVPWSWCLLRFPSQI